MPDIRLFPGELSQSDVRLRDPTTAPVVVPVVVQFDGVGLLDVTSTTISSVQAPRRRRNKLIYIPPAPFTHWRSVAIAGQSEFRLTPVKIVPGMVVIRTRSAVQFQWVKLKSGQVQLGSRGALMVMPVKRHPRLEALAQLVSAVDLLGEDENHGQD